MTFEKQCGIYMWTPHLWDLLLCERVNICSEYMINFPVRNRQIKKKKDKKRREGKWYVVTEFFNNLIHLFKCSYLLITTSGATCLARRKITKFSSTPLHQNNIILSCVICLFIHINIREREREREATYRERKKKCCLGEIETFFFFLMKVSTYGVRFWW